MTSETHAGAFDIYRETLSDLYAVSDVIHRGQKGFVSQTKMMRFAGSTVGRARSVAQTLIRDADTIRRSGLDHISVILSFANAAADFDGRDGKADPGSVQFRDLNQPTRSRGDDIDMINMMVPRHQIPNWLLTTNFHGLIMPGKSPGGRLVASHLITLVEVSDDLTEDEGVAAIEATFVIAERFLGRRGPAPTPAQTEAVQRTIRRRAMHIFDTHIGHGKLTAGRVATLIGVSRSSLFRAFEPMGGVLTYVRHRKLDRVYAAVRARGGATSVLQDLADQQGFDSVRQMKSTFRTRFGFSLTDVPPSSLARPGRSIANHAAHVDVPANDIVLDWLRIGEAI